ncbi:hypothetical protein Lal_00018922 [Lupinus albus]|nr:hypothetical protein Lal_00018922 [Lupinus albus]
MLFVDDIDLVGDLREELNGKLDLWRLTLEARGFRISRTKGEVLPHNYMTYNVIWYEYWMPKYQQENRLDIVEMRMLCWMSEHTRQDRIRNECTREKVGVASIVEKIVELCLRWFGYVWRKPIETPKRRVDQTEVSPIPRRREKRRKNMG